MDEDELSTEMLIHRLGEERQQSTEIHLNSESPRTTPEKLVHDTPLVGSQIPTPQTQTPPQDEVQVANGQRSLRKRKDNGHRGNALDPVEEIMKPLTDEERRNWKGWVELESDPVRIHKHTSNLPFCSFCYQ
jgi:ubiquitin carboxyl-terminal hydrolase L5